MEVIQTVDFKKYRIDVIAIELDGTVANKKKDGAIKAYLLLQGYVIHSTFPIRNTWFVRSDFFVKNFKPK